MKTAKPWLKMLTTGILASALVISGCSSSKSPEASNTPAAASEKNLKIMWWGSDGRHEATNKVLDLYTSKNEGIKFTPEFTAWDGYWSKLPTLSASRTLPDVLQMDAAYIESYVKRGLLADLSDLDLSGIVDENVLENVKIDGKLYGIPLSYNGQAMVYDKAALDQYGVTLPQNNWTWEDFFNFAREARTKLPSDKYPIDDLRNIWEWYQFYQTSKGLGPIFKEGKFNLDKDTWMEFNNIYAEFSKQGIVPKADLQLSAKENDPQTDTFAKGRVLLRGSSVGSATAVEALLPNGDIQVNSYPIGTAGGGWAQSTIFFSINADSPNIEEAKQFLKWFISDQEAGKILGTTRGIPINSEVLGAIESTLTSGEQLGIQLLDVAKTNALPFYPAPAGAEDFTATYKSELEAVMFGQITLEQAYETLVEKGKAAESNNS
ncbi:ABC transporter substrate-binding protein [Paenibacillus sinopodophylli]|uniref:ABC transporter substrate-binding protein n=1 Tax=Paenibacillus sinopodophylli TaxID=1837342 RepID=UPI00110D20C3|nr:ABC transporter substrate-binding protein [Paenibacillus sinopodophylli]